MFQISFEVHKYVEYGQAIYLIGSNANLGSWNLANARRMLWKNSTDLYENLEHTWSLNLEIEDSIFEYKYFVGSYENPLTF